MPSQRDTVILDVRRYDEKTRTWDIPLLTVKGISLLEFHINGTSIAPQEFSTKGNHLVLSRSLAVTEDAKASIVIEYNSTNLLVAFWLPIIISVLGLVGTIGQPLLHSGGFLYKPDLPPLEIKGTWWDYDYENHRFQLELLCKNLVQSDMDKWTIFVGVMKDEENANVDARYATYRYVGGPFDLKDIVKLTVNTDSVFTGEVNKKGILVRGAVFLVQRGTHISQPFDASKYSAPVVKYIAAPGTGR